MFRKAWSLPWSGDRQGPRESVWWLGGCLRRGEMDEADARIVVVGADIINWVDCGEWKQRLNRAKCGREIIVTQEFIGWETSNPRSFKSCEWIRASSPASRSSPNVPKIPPKLDRRQAEKTIPATKNFTKTQKGQEANHWLLLQQQLNFNWFLGRFSNKALRQARQNESIILELASRLTLSEFDLQQRWNEKQI